VLRPTTVAGGGSACLPSAESTAYRDCGCMSGLGACAVERRRFPVGASPTAPGLVGGDQRRPAAAEAVEDDPVPIGHVPHGIGKRATGFTVGCSSSSLSRVDPREFMPR
jgi:hypothetical protein